jgi:ribosomal protein S18 acetylase RimI-like enzyme
MSDQSSTTEGGRERSRAGEGAPVRGTSPLRFEPLTDANLGVYRALLGSSDFGGCFCAVWTSHGPDWESRCGDPAQPNYAITERDVLDGRRAGYLVYEGDALVGWTGSGPKPGFPLLASRLGSRLTRSTADIWSIGCIALAAAHRARGLSDRVVDACVELARSRGAAQAAA